MSSIRAMRRAAVAVVLCLLVCAPSVASASEFLFRGSSDDGDIFSVRTDQERGQYRWYLGSLGEFEGRISRGTRVRLHKRDIQGSIGLDDLGDVVLDLGGSSSVLQEGSFGFQCYVATLKHHGAYRAKDFEHDYIYRDAGSDGAMWSAKVTPKKHVYRWYMGALGRGVAKVKGRKVHLKTDGVRGTLTRDKVGDVSFRASDGQTLHFAEGTLGYGVFKATLVHAGKWKGGVDTRQTLFENATAEGAIWKVVTGSKRGEYVWYMGALGRAVGRLKGRKLTLKGERFEGAIYVNASNELVLESAEGDAFLSPSSLGYGAYKASLRHFGTWKAGLGVVEFLFRDASQDGTIWSVKKGARKGTYDWDVGPMGRVTASVRGTTVRISSSGVTGKVFVNDDNDVVLSSGGEQVVFQELSLGFSAYKATLQDAGTWRATIGAHEYLHKDVTADGQLWSVRATPSKRRYIWYMGQLGRAEVRVKGDIATITSAAVYATIDAGPKGDPVVRFLTGPGGQLIQEQVLHPGSAGEVCYRVMQRHAATR
ncbi:MAG: hypothetical protein ACPGU1_14560 [Myxococcota bacterium]